MLGKKLNTPKTRADTCYRLVTSSEGAGMLRMYVVNMWGGGWTDALYRKLKESDQKESYLWDVVAPFKSSFSTSTDWRHKFDIFWDQINPKVRCSLSKFIFLIPYSYSTASLSKKLQLRPVTNCNSVSAVTKCITSNSFLNFWNPTFHSSPDWLSFWRNTFCIAMNQSINLSNSRYNSS